jgi:hypothetical protein
LNITFNPKNGSKVGDITPSLAVNKNNTQSFPDTLGPKKQEQVEADPSSSVTSDISPITTEHPESAVNHVTEGAAPANNMTSLSNQNSTSDMPVPPCDECFSRNMCHADRLAPCNVLPLGNIDENGSGISNAQTAESDVVLKLLAQNVSDIEPAENTVNGISIWQNESQMTAVRSEVEEKCQPVRSKEKLLIAQESLESSTTNNQMNIPSVFGSSKTLESNFRRNSQIINSGTTAGESESSKIEENCENGKTDSVLPEYLKIVLDGMDACGDSGCPLDAKPEGFDLDKFRRGQRVAMRYLFGLLLAETLSLLMILSFPGSLRSLIFTKKSDTPYKSFKRYLSTATRVRSWYSDDIWQPGTDGNKNIEVVRAMHEKARNDLHNTKPDEVSKKGTLSRNCTFACKYAAVWSPLYETIREDFQGSCPCPRRSQLPFLRHQKNQVFVNQMEMAITQFGFVGLFILFPHKFGAHGVSDEDMNAFVYLWRCIGYVLGTDDAYNLCNGDLETVRQRCRDVINFWVKPNLRDVSRDWEHMSRCIVQGINFYVPGITFEISLLYLCSILNIYAPRLRAALTFKQAIFYHLMNLVFLVLMRLPGVYLFFNWLLSLSIRYAQMASFEVLSKLEKKYYPCEDQPPCTRL